MSEGIFHGGVAHFDQQHAEAMERLRHSHTFIVATMDADTGQVDISIAGPDRYGHDMLPSFVGTVAQSLMHFVHEAMDDE